MVAPIVVLFRGINVGGKNVVPMAELRALAAGLGAESAATLIQSGNLVVSVEASQAAAFVVALEAGVLARFGVRSPLVTRTAEQWRAVLPAAPFADEGALHVAFLQSRPALERVAALDPLRSPGDAFAVVGQEVYLHLPNGVARTKLTNDWLDRSLGTVSTVRNTRTVAAIAELLAGR